MSPRPPRCPPIGRRPGRARSIGSLKVTTRFASARTPVAPSVGETDTIVGGVVSGGGAAALAAVVPLRPPSPVGPARPPVAVPPSPPSSAPAEGVLEPPEPERPDAPDPEVPPVSVPSPPPLPPGTRFVWAGPRCFAASKIVVATADGYGGCCDEKPRPDESVKFWNVAENHDRLLNQEKNAWSAGIAPRVPLNFSNPPGRPGDAQSPNQVAP